MDATLFVMRQRDLHRYHTLRLVLDHRTTGRHQPAAEGPPPPPAHGSSDDRGPAGPAPRQSGPPFPAPPPASHATTAPHPGPGRYAGLKTTHLTEKLQSGEGLAVSRPTVYRLRKAQEGRLLLWDGSPHSPPSGLTG